MATDSILEFQNGLKMPALGLGTWQSPREEVRAAVVAAIEAGYRHLDCAMIYRNEDVIGDALKECFNRGLVKREDLFITSKVWNTLQAPATVPKALKKTCDDLGVTYVDLYLIHWPTDFKESWDMAPVKDKKPDYGDIDYVDTWKGMEECVDTGLAKYIGVSNFNSHQVKRVVDSCKIRPVANQVECHPFLSQKPLHEFCRNLGVEIIAYSPLGASNNPWKSDADPSIWKNDVIATLAKKHNKTPAQIVLRWNIQRRIAVIPKSTNKDRINQNIQVFDFKLSTDDMDQMDALNRNWRAYKLDAINDHPDWPFNIPF